MNWTDYAMAVPSLFPLVGAIGKLRNFFPSGFRAWFVVLSTTFGFAMYLYTQNAYESIPFYIPIYVPFVVAFGALVVYIVTVYTSSPMFKHRRFHINALAHNVSANPPRYTWRGNYKIFAERLPRAILLVLMLSLYTVFVLALTYGFNALEQQLVNFRIYRGQVVIEASGAPAPGATVEFHFDTNADARKTLTNGNGRFFEIVPRSIDEHLNAIRVLWSGKDSKQYHATINHAEAKGFITLALKGG